MVRVGHSSAAFVVWLRAAVKIAVVEPRSYCLDYLCVLLKDTPSHRRPVLPLLR